MGGLESTACERRLTQQRQRADDAERRLAEVTADRDGWQRSKERWARASMRERLRAEKAETELAALKASIAAAPVAWINDTLGAVYRVEMFARIDAKSSGSTLSRVRLLPDQQPKTVYPSEGEVSERGVTVAEMALEPEVINVSV